MHSLSCEDAVLEINHSVTILTISPIIKTLKSSEGAMIENNKTANAFPQQKIRAKGGQTTFIFLEGQQIWNR